MTSPFCIVEHDWVEWDLYRFEVVDTRLPGRPCRGRFESRREALARVAELELAAAKFRGEVA